MRRKARRPLLLSGFLACLYICTGAQAAEFVVPSVHGFYLQRLELLSSGGVPKLFLGGASVVPDRSQPYMVSLGIKGVRTALGHYCGGVIVDSHWVLTAAHCVSTVSAVDGRNLVIPLEPGKVQVMESSNVLFRDGRIRSISRFVIHPEHRLAANKVPENDLALIQFSEPLVSKPVRVANVEESEKLLQTGAFVRILGWGTATFTADSPISNNLLSAFVEVRERAKCNEPDSYNGAVTSSMFCAGLGVADACQGDSGGPAVGYVNGQPHLVGIISWGAGCAKKNFPGVYVNVAQYHGWINATVRASKQ